MKTKKKTKKLGNARKGFTLLEVLIGIALIGIISLGLAQLLNLSALNNLRSDKISNATFLAQQQIDNLRNFTVDELNAAVSNPIDEKFDTNEDGTYEFRRITQLELSGFYWDVKVYVFSGPYQGADQGADLDKVIQNPSLYGIKAQMNTIISR